MKDAISNARTLLMHPKLRDELAAIGNEIDIALTNATVRWAYTIRTVAEQNELYAQGRTKLFDKNGKRLGIVTNAKGGQSYHNYGLAADMVLLVNNAASWDTVKDYDKDNKPDWQECVTIFKAHGWEWGGDFKSIKDKPHFQKTFGFSVKQLSVMPKDMEGYVIWS